jgi:hypothetical protein
MSKSLHRRVLLWHRWLGLASVPFVLLLVVTGVVLERTDKLELDQRHVTDEWLLTWYGVTPPDDPVSYQVSGQWVSWLAGTLYLDGRSVQQSDTALTGAVALGPAIVASTEDALYLFTTDGELVEKVTPIGVDGAIDAITVGPDDDLFIRIDGGVFASNIDMAVWRATVDGTVVWPTSRPEPDAIHAAIVQSYRGMGLPWERVLLDLHSGRLLGFAGPYLMDGAALLLLLLSASGIYNWVRRR